MKNQQIILTKESSTEENFASVISLPIAKLKPFANHPYKVIDNEEMQCLAESIKSQGVLNPITVHPLENGDYEIISGHRRVLSTYLKKGKDREIEMGRNVVEDYYSKRYTVLSF